MMRARDCPALPAPLGLRTLGGALAVQGVKRIVRSDVLYTLPGRPAAQADDETTCAAEADAR
jgi:hypothetical protein